MSYRIRKVNFDADLVRLCRGIAGLLTPLMPYATLPPLAAPLRGDTLYYGIGVAGNANSLEFTGL
jgi:hypothetical protein